jgi:hypothetical protein
LKAKVVLLARINDGKKYPFLPVEIKKGRPAPVDGVVTGYYLCYRQNGKRTVRQVGKSLDAAFVGQPTDNWQIFGGSHWREIPAIPFSAVGMTCPPYLVQS